MGAPSAEEWKRFFRVYAICTLAIFTKYFVSLLMGANPTHHPDEDKIIGVDNKAEIDDAVKRRVRVAGNDMENIPMHLVMFWAAFVVQNFANANDTGDRATTALTVLIVLYCALRYIFTACYLFGLQPFRTIAFVLSQLTVFCTLIIMVNSAFQVDIGA
jgi:uncharacterized MAPEG superfamily protein